MRHRRSRHKLNRSASHRKALGANLATALLTHGRIQTTLPKARLAREVAEKAITLGKDGSLHARRQAIALLRNKEVTYSLFDQIAPAFADVNGGYTRTLKLGPRPGDAAEMVLLELTAVIDTDAETADAVASAPAVAEPAQEDAAEDEAAEEVSEAEEEPEVSATSDDEDSEPVAEEVSESAEEGPAAEDESAEDADGASEADES
ncbi:MAG: 50S ribosomal protein L17 [Thermoleophilia bacterium]|nr:50S ribosomal protein L17 [Thermoleophilia bacterium]